VDRVKHRSAIRFILKRSAGGIFFPFVNEQQLQRYSFLSMKVCMNQAIRLKIRKTNRSLFVVLVTALILPPTSIFADEQPQPPKPVSHTERVVEGWKVRVDDRLLAGPDASTGERALKLLAARLLVIELVVPEPALSKIRTVRIQLDLTHGALRAMQYHPSAGWLKGNGYREDLAKCVHIPDVAQFISPFECHRQPWAVLHELAHAYHDQVLTFEESRIHAAWEKFRDSGRYESVLTSPGGMRKHYGLTNHKEFFAEMTESYLGSNDFYPFVAGELKSAEPEIFSLMETIWGSLPGRAKRNTALNVKTPTPEMKLDAFYKKYVDIDGYLIVGSDRISDYALKEAAFLVNQMLAKRPDVRQAMIKSGSRMCLLAYNEYTTDLPEYVALKPKDFYDVRARGLGGSRTDPVCSAAEENLLGYEGDPYSTECILIHEFAHNIHLRGMVNVDPTFDDRLKETYKQAMDKGLWKGKYAATNHHEYFAEGVQSWFNNNRPPDHDHNHVDTRAELIEYDPGLAAMCREVFRDTELVYTKPTTRLRDHLAGYDPAKAPKFEWPERLKKAREEVRQKARAKAGSDNP